MSVWVYFFVVSTLQIWSFHIFNFLHSMIFLNVVVLYKAQTCLLILWRSKSCDPDKSIRFELLTSSESLYFSKRTTYSCLVFHHIVSIGWLLLGCSFMFIEYFRSSFIRRLRMEQKKIINIEFYQMELTNLMKLAG